MKFGFVGAFYTSESPIADAQQTINFYPELVESLEGRNRIVLYPTAGLAEFCEPASVGPNRGEVEVAGRFFSVIRDKLWEVDSSAVATERGTLTVSTNPVFFAASQAQLLVVAEGLGYVLNLSTNVFAQISDPDFPADVITCGYVDGYFIVLAADNNFYISALDDATSWDALDFGTVESSENTLVGMIISVRVVWIFGNKITQGFWNSGNPDFPFEAIPSATIPQGCAAVAAISRLPGTDTVVFVAANESGTGTIYALQGQAIERVSDHSVENALNGYSSLSDAVSFPYEERGHVFYSVTFPSGDVTWRYDRTLSQQLGRSMWHQALYRDPATNQFEAHRAMYHAFCFGKHLVGDRENGKIYQMQTPLQADDGTVTFADDDGDPIKRVRRCPHVSYENKTIFYGTLEVILEAGLGWGTGQGANPQVMMTFSNDGGQTFPDDHMRQKSAGRIGKYRTRVRFDRLGSARDRVFEVSFTDPVPWKIIDAELTAEVGQS